MTIKLNKFVRRRYIYIVYSHIRNSKHMTQYEYTTETPKNILIKKLKFQYTYLSLIVTNFILN